MMETKQKTILYVDDDVDDQELLKEAISSADADVKVVLASNGLEALDWLQHRKEKQDSLPCLIVLDLNMPFLDGREVHTRLKSDSRLQQVPVIIFSSSEKPADKLDFNRAGAEYFTKPADCAYLNNIALHMVNRCCC